MQIFGSFNTSFVSRGFVRDPLTGALQFFAPPPNSVDGTLFAGINNSGQVAGTYQSGGARVGFIRTGPSYVTFTIPDAFGLTVDSINDLGDVAGTFFSTTAKRFVVYLRLASGELREVVMPFSLNLGPNYTAIALDGARNIMLQINDTDTGVFEALLARPA